MVITPLFTTIQIIMIPKSFPIGMLIGILLSVCLSTIEEFTFPTILETLSIVFSNKNLYISSNLIVSICQVLGVFLVGFLCRKYKLRLPFLLSIFGMMVSYIMAMLSIFYHNVNLFFASRAVAGVCLSAQSINDNAIISSVKVEHQEKALVLFELFTCAISIFMNYLLNIADSSQIRHRNTTYLFFAIITGISLICFIISKKYFKNLYQSEKHVIDDKIMKHDGHVIILLGIIYFLYEVAFSLFIQGVPLIAIRNLHLSPIVCSQILTNISISSMMYGAMALMFPKALRNFSFLLIACIGIICLKGFFLIFQSHISLHFTSIIGFLDRGFYMNCVFLVLKYKNLCKYLDLICSATYLIENIAQAISSLIFFMIQFHKITYSYAFILSSCIIVINLILLLVIRKKLGKLPQLEFNQYEPTEDRH